MAASMRKMFSLRSILRNIPSRCGCKQITPRSSYCIEVENKKKIEVGSFLDELTEELDDDTGVENTEEPKSFATLFRNSAFVQLGELKDRKIVGRIMNIVGEDLYIDFGGKFYCVCSRPSFRAERYVQGQRVELVLHQFEMSSKFLGSPQHVTLLEADCTLLGLFDHEEPRANRLKEKSVDDETDLNEQVDTVGLSSKLMDTLHDNSVIDISKESVANVEKIDGDKS
ncbi:37S ribosomal protein S28 [Mactra antiquata]